jgi:hypothetical protein
LLEDGVLGRAGEGSLAAAELEEFRQTLHLVRTPVLAVIFVACTTLGPTFIKVVTVAVIGVSTRGDEAAMPFPK